MIDRISRPDRGIVLPAIATALMVALALGLGVWQLQRKAEKDAASAGLAAQGDAGETMPLPPPNEWSRLRARTDEFRRVRFEATLLKANRALVYTSGSPMRPDVSGQGYWVFAPLRLPGGETVVANLGFLPQGSSAADHADGDSRQWIGRLRFAERRHWYTLAPDRLRHVWLHRDHHAMAEAESWGAVAPFYIDIEAPAPPSGLPRPGPLRVQFRNDHAMYAITWFLMAGALLVGFGVWVRNRRPRLSNP